MSKACLTKRPIIPKWGSNFYGARDSDRTNKFLNNWSLVFTQFAQWHGKVQPQVICKINHSQELKKVFALKIKSISKWRTHFGLLNIANNGNTLHFFLTPKRQTKNNNNLNPLLSPPLPSKPSFSEEESFNNKPPLFLPPPHLPFPYYSSLINKRPYQSMMTVKLCVDQSGWFIHQVKVRICFWSFLLDLQPSCTWAFSLDLFFFFFFEGN